MYGSTASRFSLPTLEYGSRGEYGEYGLMHDYLPTPCI